MCTSLVKLVDAFLLTSQNKITLMNQNTIFGCEIDNDNYIKRNSTPNIDV